MKRILVCSLLAAAVSLASCGGRQTVPVQPQTLTQSGSKHAMATPTCAPAWQDGGTYSAGQMVSYNAGSGTHNYTALVNQTDYTGAGWNPTVGSLYSDDGSCGGSSTATPSPTPKPSATPTKTASPTPKPSSTPGAGCYTAWNASTAYSGGAQVSYNGVNYTAAYWTQGNEPDTNNGPAGSGQPWISDGSCGGGTSTPKPTPTPTKTASPTPKPTATPTKTPSPTPTPSSNTYTVNATITFYGWPDNSPPGCAIANPVIHQCAGGDGSYNNPTTFATETANDSSIPYGTVIYVPTVKKYFIREDSCAGCTGTWFDLWIGGDANSNSQEVINCEDNLTPGGTVQVVVNPPSNESVNWTGPIYNDSPSPNGSCNGTPM